MSRLARTVVPRPRPNETVLDPAMAGQLDAVLQHPFFRFAGLDAVQQAGVTEALRVHARLRVCPHPDEVLARRGEHGGTAFLVLEGRVRVYVPAHGPVPGVAQPAPVSRPAGLLSGLVARLRSPGSPEWRAPDALASPAGRQAHEPRTPRPIFLDGVPGTLDPRHGATLGPGSLFGELAALTRGPRVATVASDGPCRLLELRWQGLRALTEAAPQLGRRLEAAYDDRTRTHHLQHCEILQDVGRHPRIAGLAGDPAHLLIEHVGWQAVDGAAGLVVPLPGSGPAVLRPRARQRGQLLLVWAAGHRPTSAAERVALLQATCDRLQATELLVEAATTLGATAGTVERRIADAAAALDSEPVDPDRVPSVQSLRGGAEALRLAADHQRRRGNPTQAWPACVAARYLERAADGLSLASIDAGARRDAADLLLRAAAALTDLRRAAPRLILVTPQGRGRLTWQWRLLRPGADAADSDMLVDPDATTLGDRLIRRLVWDELAERSTLERHGRRDWHSAPADAGPIVREGDYPDGLLIVCAGRVRVSRREGHAERTVDYLGPGRHIGLDVLQSAWPAGQAPPASPPGHRHTLRPLGYADVLTIPAEALRRLVLPTLPPPAARPPAGPPPFVEQLVDSRHVLGRATMLIDVDRCTRCDACVDACAATHGGNPRFVRGGPTVGRWQLASACLHCADPVCLLDCPTGAIARQPDAGTVVINDGTCIGCTSCAEACPFDAIRMVEIQTRVGPWRSGPVVDTDGEPIRKATKCDLCFDRAAGPACVQACAQGALVRADLTEPATLWQLIG